MSEIQSSFLYAGEVPGGSVKINYFSFKGEKSGPKMFLVAGIHGHELTGIEVARRLCTFFSHHDIAGELTIVPVANPVAFSTKQRCTAYDNMDLNRCFPGNPQGSISERMGYVLYKLFKAHDFGIDIHGGPEGRLLLPHTRIIKSNDVKKIRELSRIFGTLVSMMRNGRESMLSVYATNDGVPTMPVELGEAYRLDEKFVQAGLFGVLNVMRYYGMINGQANIPDSQFVLKTRVNLRTKSTGLFFPKVQLGDFVRKRQLLAEIINMEDGSVERVTSKNNGIVLAVLTHSIALAGQMVSSVLDFEGCDTNKVSLQRGKHIIYHKRISGNVMEHWNMISPVLFQKKL
ncbi:MAG: succinylglutamate desuccinylase/aspartoacylase family protein [Candidatus Aenigmarchaeota archaeon]|nr:succinylglutamate desuccinylase/aspartoacylase family protein [Candidatus Aenigmarchaeota archaeon]MCK5333849.1 succinylglutamate desuccinylase/aspartoacylase family protein [Candidatus Aenigmarchaeota archaeon]